jgi:protease-4
MGSAYTLPLLPIGLPLRKLNDDETKQIETSMLSLYEDFVNLVANGRKMTPEKVKEIAQGRIWSGNAGKANGLVDEIGGLDRAIEIAKQKAGITSKDKYQIVEFPTPGFMDFGAFIPGIIGINIEKPKSDIKMFQFLIENNGVPMPMIPLDFIENQGN